MNIAGIDEVGRGCWAGPLVAGAVILSRPIPGLRDSKKLSKHRREALAMQIEAEAIAAKLGWVWPDEVDTLGVSKAVQAAMERALQQLPSDEYDELIIDGIVNFLPDNPKCRALVRADDSIPEVSAASIIAKVARDRYMSEVAAELHPEYGFEKHVGYGTALHIQRLKQYGVTSMHRRSYKPVLAMLQLPA